MKSRGSGWRCALLHETSASPATTVTAQAENLRISPPNVLRARSLIRAGGQSGAAYRGASGVAGRGSGGAADAPLRLPPPPPPTPPPNARPRSEEHTSELQSR